MKALLNLFRDLALVFLLGLLGVWIWRTIDPPTPQAAPARIAEPAQHAPQIAGTGYDLIAITEPIKVRPASVKPKLKLPPAVVADTTQRVVDAVTVPASDRPVTVTPVLNAETGEVTTYTVAEPLPWLDATQRGDAGLYLGIKRGDPVLRAQARHQLLQIKAVRIGALASVDLPLNSRPGGPDIDAFIGAGAWVTW